jgi:hypothetical protein
MKKAIIALSAVLLLVSCTKPEVIEEPTLTLKGTLAQIAAGAEKSQIPISFSTNQSWTATSDAQWISLSPDKGSAGEANIMATVEENKTGKSRIGSVTITAGQLSKTVKINQSSAGGGSTGTETLIIKVVTNFHTTSFTVSVTSNSQKTYFYDVVEKTVWDKDGGDAVWRNRVKKDAICSGNTKKEYTYQKVQVEYIAFAAFCDGNGNKNGDFITEAFVLDDTVEDDDYSPITFSISNVTETSYTLKTSSSANKQYFFDVVDKETWDEYGAQAVWEAYVDYYIKDGSFVDQLVTGDADCNFRIEDQEIVAFAAYCYNDGTLQSTIFFKAYNLTDFDDSPSLSWVSIDTGLLLVVGESKILTASGDDEDFEPVEDPKVKWQSNRPSVATIDQNGNVRAIGAGIATITATALKGDASDDCKVLVVSNASDYENPMDLGLSVKWAQYNIGANRPDGYGSYYAWGESYTRAYYDGYNGPYPKDDVSFWDLHKDEIVDEDYNLYRSKDPVVQLLGGKWRLPTKKEFEELLENCSEERTKINGRLGVLYIGKKSGYTNKWIFLPNSGTCWMNYRANPSTDDCTLYWSSTINEKGGNNIGYARYESAWGLQIDRTGEPPSWINCWERIDGNPIRPVYSD